MLFFHSCSDGYLKIYLKGQETTDSYDKFDYEMCGGQMKPSIVVSDGPRLVMVFSSGEAMGKGFKANYTFETEYRIPGTAAPDGSCTFTYRSTSRKRVNSTHHVTHLTIQATQIARIYFWPQTTNKSH